MVLKPNPEQVDEEEIAEGASQIDPSEIEEALEEKDPAEGRCKIELFLSTDGKHTVHMATEETGERRKIILAKTMELYDFVVARYGTKQAQAVKEYGNGVKKPEEAPTQETCSHAQFKFTQSKTEKNPGRWFRSCALCGKFLGWQS